MPSAGTRLEALNASVRTITEETPTMSAPSRAKRNWTVPGTFPVPPMKSVSAQEALTSASVEEAIFVKQIEISVEVSLYPGNQDYQTKVNTFT